MPHLSDIVLTSIPSSENERLLVVRMHSTKKTSRLELRQQSFSAGIGWFTQSSIQLEPEQVAALRNALGSAASPRAKSRLSGQFRKIAAPAWQPKVVHAGSA